jgi:hypothetical protein
MKLLSFALAILSLFCFATVPELRPANHQNSRRQMIEKDVGQLYSDSDSIRVNAANRLVQVGEEAIPLVLPVLCDKAGANSDVAWRSAAKILGELKAESAAPCLIQKLALGDVTLSVFKSEKTIAEYDPAFAALVQIGQPTIPAIQRALPSLHPDKAYLALRVLRVINTPEAKAVAEGYLKLLERQAKLTSEVVSDFSYGPGLVK